MQRGDVCIVFTPDNTHFSIAAAALSAGLHVLMAKPLVKTLQHHQQLLELAEKQGVLVRGGRVTKLFIPLCLLITPLCLPTVHSACAFSLHFPQAHAAACSPAYASSLVLSLRPYCSLRLGNRCT